MQIPRGFLDSYTEALNTLSEATQRAVLAQLGAIEYVDMADLRKQALAILEPLLEASTDMAAAYSATSYDAVREASVGAPMNAQAHSGRVPEATEGAVRALVGRVDRMGYQSFLASLAERCDYEIKRAAAESTLHNAMRDPAGPRFARVPTGAETCRFCLMLASRGFVYLSEKTAGALNHWHPNCDCRIVQGYEGMEVEGYDPDFFYDVWRGKQEFTIPERKITDYALKEANKAKAFKNYLGYDEGDANELVNKLYAAAYRNKPSFRDSTEWGDRYASDVVIEGKNGKIAKVRIGWIKDNDTGRLRLTTVFVKGRAEVDET